MVRRVKSISPEYVVDERKVAEAIIRRGQAELRRRRRRSRMLVADDPLDRRTIRP
jgi:hypothetical protein